jgi:hypothetical protein
MKQVGEVYINASRTVVEVNVSYHVNQFILHYCF